MADEGYGRTFSGDPNPPPTPPAPAPAPVAAPEESGGGAAAPVAGQAAQQSRPAKALFRVSADEDGKQSVYMMDDKLETTRLGPVSIGNADELLSAVGEFNPATGAWRVPEAAAKQLLSGDLPIPDYVPAKYRANKAMIAQGVVMTNWMRGKLELEDALSQADLEALKMQVKDAPLFVWQGDVVSTAAKMWADMKEAGATGVVRRAAGETAGLAAFATDSPMAAAAGMALLAPVVASRGALAPAVVPVVAAALNYGADALVFKRSYEIEGGLAAKEMLDKGFEPSTVKNLAPLVGIMNGALEVVGFHMLTAPFKRVVARKVLMSEAVKKALASAYVNYMKELGGEVTTEIAQERVNILAENFAADLDERPDLKVGQVEGWNRSLDVGLRVLAGLPGAKVPGLVVEAGARAMDNRADAKAQGERTKKVEAALAPVPEAAAPAAPAAPAEGAAPAAAAPAQPGGTQVVDTSGDYLPRAEKASASVDDLVKQLDEGKATPETAVDQVAAAVAALDEPPPGFGDKVIEVERKALLETRRRELEANQAQIKALEKERTRYQSRGMGTKVVEGRIDKLLEENANIRGDIEFHANIGPRNLLIDENETLSMKPATLENVVELGFKEGLKETAKVRAKKIHDVAKRLDLTTADVAQLLKDRSFSTMGNEEFSHWVESKFKPAAKEAFRRKVTLRDVRQKQAAQRLQQEVNVRRQHKLPSVQKMTVEQMREYMDILDTFDRGDRVLSPRRVEALKTTPAAGARTMGEVNERTAELWGMPLDTAVRMLPDAPIIPDITRGMERLAARSPMHKAMVQATESTIEGEDVAYMPERETLYALGAKALASRKGLLGRLLNPTMPEVVAHLEADDAQVYAGQVTLPTLTKEEQAFVDFVDEVYAKHYNYLQIVEGLKSRYENKYYTHTERGFVEILAGIKDAGWRQTFKELYQSSIPETLDFSVVGPEGKQVGLRAHMKQTMFRSGTIKKPSMNAIAVVDGYLRAVHKKRALDKLVPWVDTMVDAAIWSDKDVTAEGETRKKAFDHFVNSYLKQKKGGTILAEAVWHNGFIDVVARTMMSLPSWAFIAFNVGLQTKAKIGEVIASIPVGGVGIFDAWRLRLLAAVPAKMRGELGTAVSKYLAANEGLTGQPILDLDAFLHGEFKGRFTEAGVPVNERAGMLMYGLLQQHRVDTMRDVLLALSTREEIMSGKITAERLAEIKMLASRWIDVKGSKSVLGATSPGAMLTQFKGWAIPIIGTTIEDHVALVKQLAGKGKMSELQKLELRRLHTTWAVTAAVSYFVVQNVDDDDDSWTAQFLKGALRELMTLTGGANPLLFFGVPAIAYLERLGTAISMTLKGERYKTGEREGDFKGPPALMRLVPGNRLARQVGLTGEKEK